VFSYVVQSKKGTAFITAVSRTIVTSFGPVPTAIVNEREAEATLVRSRYLKESELHNNNNNNKKKNTRHFECYAMENIVCTQLRDPQEP